MRKKLTELEYYNLFLSESKESPFLQKEKKAPGIFDAKRVAAFRTNYPRNSYRSRAPIPNQTDSRSNHITAPSLFRKKKTRIRSNYKNDSKGPADVAKISQKSPTFCRNYIKYMLLSPNLRYELRSQTPRPFSPRSSRKRLSLATESPTQIL